MGFRENLKYQLEYANMTVKELSAISGIKKKTIESYLGSQGYNPSVNTAFSIAKALGVSLDYLLTGNTAFNERAFTTLPRDIQEIVHIAERLSAKDREIFLCLARLFRKK